MSTRKDIIAEHTFPDLGPGPRVVATLEARPEHAASRTRYLLAHLIDHLVREGTLKESQLDNMLCDAVIPDSWTAQP